MRLEARSIALAIAGVACAIAAIVGVACIVAPPPGLPTESPRPPRILRSTAIPPLDTPLLQWPADNVFSVTVDPEWPENPSAAPSYRVFVDSSPQPYVGLPSATTPNGDGLSLIAFPIYPQNTDQPLDLGACHTIQLIVTRSFTSTFPGSDSAVWTYPGPNQPYGCIDASADGQPPPASDAADGPFIPPSEGGGVDP